MLSLSNQQNQGIHFHPKLGSHHSFLKFERLTILYISPLNWIHLLQNLMVKLSIDLSKCCSYSTSWERFIFLNTAKIPGLSKTVFLCYPQIFFTGFWYHHKKNSQRISLYLASTYNCINRIISKPRKQHLTHIINLFKNLLIKNSIIIIFKETNQEQRESAFSHVCQYTEQRIKH